MQTVGDVMIGEVRTVTEYTSVEECARIMHARRIRHLPVVDRSGTLCGIATEADVMAHLRVGNPSRWVSEIATQSEVTARADDHAIPTLARLLMANQEAVVVVNDRGQPVGIFTHTDALQLAELVVAPWMTVSEIIGTRPLISVPPNMAASEALALMKERRIHHLLVFHRRRIQGIVAHKDLVGQGEEPVGNLSLVPRGVVRANSPVSQVVGLMTFKRIYCLPVVRDDDTPIGVISRKDLLRVLLRQLLEASKKPAPERAQRPV